MSRRTGVMLAAGAALVAGVAATGFPRRIGLTRSQAAISLPGDLLVPGATFVTDRSVLVRASAERVWEVLRTFVEEDEDMRIRIEVPGDCLVLASSPVPEEDRGSVRDVDVSWSFAILPESDGRVRLHLRERHEPHSRAARLACWADAALMAPMTMGILADVRRLAELAD